MRRKLSWDQKCKRWVVRFAWAGPIIGFVIGLLFGSGAVWKYFDYRFKMRSASLDQTNAEREFLARIHSVHEEILSAIQKYVVLRDRHSSPGESYLVQHEYLLTKLKLVSLVGEYNRLEVDIGRLENRPPRFFALPLPPPEPKNVQFEGIENGNIQVFSCDPPLQDALVTDVTEELKTLFKANGHKYPSDESWEDPNAAVFDLSKVGYVLYAVPSTNGPATNVYRMDPSTYRIYARTPSSTNSP